MVYSKIGKTIMAGATQDEPTQFPAGRTTSESAKHTPVAEQAYRSAVRELLDTMRDNPWFVENHWPLNEPHVRAMIDDVSSRLSADESHHVLDVGCFNGYICFLFRKIGYRVTGADAKDYDDRTDIFASSGISFVRTNFNSLEALPDVADETFDVVILAQVIEHILNHPVGFVGELARVTKPGGLIIITTPQPASFMNAWRLLRGNWSLWETDDFIRMLKFADGEIISHPEIHYREYLSSEVVAIVEAAGYEVLTARYLGFGVAKGQSTLKRLLKSRSIARWLMTKRLFASNHYVLARKQAR